MVGVLRRRPAASVAGVCGTSQCPVNARGIDAVTQAVREISHFSEEIRKIPVDDPNGAYWILSPKAVGRMKEMREHATAAFNALAKIAKDPEVVEPGKLLHDEQQPT
jgi:hypothetical protein